MAYIDGLGGSRYAVLDEGRPGELPSPGCLIVRIVLLGCIFWGFCQDEGAADEHFKKAVLETRMQSYPGRLYWFSGCPPLRAICLGLFQVAYDPSCIRPLRAPKQQSGVC